MLMVDAGGLTVPEIQYGEANSLFPIHVEQSLVCSINVCHMGAKGW